MPYGDRIASVKFSLAERLPVFGPRKIQDMRYMATKLKDLLCFSLPKKNPMILSSRG